ncbi:hypothetical protein ACGFKZ_08320 [Micromonospora tulbaghiae]|uniref:hypothetical protein n=1 Tax=Micromonospora tulbaghiae TaxID=479978 RepID=UPI00332017F8
MLRAAVPPGPGNLFITGDPHQRIYESWVSLGSLGISVTGAAGCASTTAAPMRSSPGRPRCLSTPGAANSAATERTVSPATGRCCTAVNPRPTGTRRRRPR